MRKLKSLWRGAFDVREGEHGRTLFMALYFMFVLFALTILKSVSWALFLDRFDISRLAYLYILIAISGGVLAYFYTKIVLRGSLRTAVGVSTWLCVASLAAFWWLLDAGSWLLYVFNVWVGMYGIAFVSQGWLVAANVFDGREAKRLYGLLGLGAILGAVLGGGFTAFTVEYLGTRNLLPAGAVMVVLAYAAFRAVAAQKGVVLVAVPSRDEDEEDTATFTLHDLVSAVLRYRHLLVIVGVICLTYVVEVLVEFQFSALAKQTYSGDELTAFLGKFSGLYVNTTTFVLQFLFTTLIVARLGVGGALKISPLAMGAATLGVLVSPRLLTAAITRLVEAATRNSVNRTAIELLYLPLPSKLRNRTKAFIDVFVDRLGRGLAGLLLVVLAFLHLDSPQRLSVFIIGLAGLWILLSLRAKREYISTVRRRVESRRLDLEGARITVQDTETVRLLEQVARGSNSRQVIYALSLLDEAPGYNPGPLLSEIVNSPSAIIRAKVYELARKAEYPDLLNRALAEVRSGESVSEDLAEQAVGYILAVSPNTADLAAEFVNHSDYTLAEAALKALSGQRDLVRSLVTKEWLAAAAEGENPEKRALAAFTVGVRGDEGTDVLHRLLEDPSRRVVAVACRSAGVLRNHDYVEVIVRHLADARLRGAAIKALTGYGEEICGPLGELLEDEATPLPVQRHIPRVLAGVPSQASVNSLQKRLGLPNLTVRTAVLKALNRLCERAPEFDCGEEAVTRQIRREAQSYFELYAALTRLRERQRAGKATALLTRTVEERLKQIIGRLFRLLGLRYPPKQIYAAYLAVSHQRSEEFATALEFLDNILDRDLKRILLPLIEGSPHLLEIGRDVFGVEVPDPETAMRQLLRSGDGWLVVCAIASAAELRMKRLAADIARVSERGGPEVAQVARAAFAALA